MADLAKSIVNAAEKAFDGTERANARATWDLLAEFITPNQWTNFQGDQTKGAKKTGRLFDGTALQANNDLAASIHATLTNPAAKWSTITFKDPELNNDTESSSWLGEVNKRIHEEINESNFASMVAKNYQSFTSLGNMVLLEEERDPASPQWDGLQFTAWHMSEVAFAENFEGVIDTVYRKFKWPIHKILQRFPDSIPERLQKKMERSPDDEEEIIHCIKPRDPRGIKESPSGIQRPEDRPFMSVYVLKTGGVLLEEGGFFELPFFATRWSTLPGEVYGRGPGHLGLPDIRTLNRLKQLALKAINKAVDPPLIASERDVLGNFDMRPGRVTWVRDVNGIREMPPAARFDVTQFKEQDLRESIRAAFFIDKLMLPPRTETGEQTAFEISQRLEQMQRVLGPQLSRLNSEFLSPLIVRTFKMLLRSGTLPPPPPTVQERGLNIDIKFVNPLARSLELEDVNNAMAWFQSLLVVAQAKPEILDHFDADVFADLSHDSRGLPPELIRDVKVVQQERQARAQQAQQQAMLEAGTQVANIAAQTKGMEE